MKNLSTKIKKNPYIRTVKEHATFLNLLKLVINKINKQLKIKKKNYFHVLIQYPQIWPTNLDFFSFIPEEVITEIKNNNCYFIFDASAEGFSPTYYTNWFENLYYTCTIHEVDPRQIIFVSSNLKDEDNIEKYSKNVNKQPFNVISLPLFENSCQIHEDVYEKLNLTVTETYRSFKDKYFSSLSRLNRHHRSIATFLLCQSKFKNRGLISHNRLKHSFGFYEEISNRTDYKEKDFKRWYKSLPLIVDYKDFNINWAIDRKFDHIHNQTLFQIVNETLAENYNDTSLFYSEKTFRPISYFQPFLIFGQKGCNHYLKELGYKLYDEWFDLSFDFEDDYFIRYQKLLAVVEDTCRRLESLTRNEQIEWKFKNKEILIHNVKTMNQQKYIHDKLNKFVIKLENQIFEQLR
jgi:hypothetical protein